MGPFLRFLAHLAAVICLVIAAFGWLKNDTVSWFILGIALWCAAYLSDPVGPPARRRTE